MPDVSIGYVYREGAAKEASSGVYDDPGILMACFSKFERQLFPEGDPTLLRFRDPDYGTQEEAFERYYNEIRPQVTAYARKLKSSGVPSDRISVPEEVLERHTLLFGGSGGGKSSLAWKLISEQLKQGRSLVAIDRDASTLNKLRAAAHAAKVLPERVAVIDAGKPGSIPGINPMLIPGTPGKKASVIVNLMRDQVNAGAGERMNQYLAAAVTIAVWHNLRFQDIPRLLLEQGFRERVLSEAPAHPKSPQYVTQANFFKSRFVMLRPSEREFSALAVDSRFQQFDAVPLFQTMLNAQRNTVDFDSLFKEQGVVLVYLTDQGGLDNKAKGLVAGYVTTLLQSVEQRNDAVPVILSVDEVGDLIDQVGGPIKSIVNTARKRSIRMILSTQHPGQFPSDLREDVVSSSDFKVVFKDGNFDNVEKSAAMLAARSEGEEKEETDPVGTVRAGYPVTVYDGYLYCKRLGDKNPTVLHAYEKPPEGTCVVDTSDPDVGTFAQHGFRARPPITLALPKNTSARETFQGLPPGSVELRWEKQGAKWFARATVTVPKIQVVEPAPKKPKKAKSARDVWLKALLALPPGRAAVVIGTAAPLVAQIDRVDPPADAPADYIEKSRKATAVPLHVPEEIPMPKEPEPPAPKQKAEPPAPEPKAERKPPSPKPKAEAPKINYPEANPESFID